MSIFNQENAPHRFTYKPILWKCFSNWSSSPQVFLACIKLTRKVKQHSDGGTSRFSTWGCLEILLHLLSLSFVLGCSLTLFSLLNQQSCLLLTIYRDTGTTKTMDRNPIGMFALELQSHMDTQASWENQVRECPSRSSRNPPVQIHH